MEVSLTREEFNERLLQNSDLFSLAIAQDVRKMLGPDNKIGSARVAIKPGQTDYNISLDITPQLVEIVGRAIKRAVDLVYDEKLNEKS